MVGIKKFPKGSSPGGFQLRGQHLHVFDAICGTNVPASLDCLMELTKWVSVLLYRNVDSRISPWLCGAPLAALNKKDGGIRPIAIRETIYRLVSLLRCSAIYCYHPDVFLLEGQVSWCRH